MGDQSEFRAFGGTAVPESGSVVCRFTREELYEMVWSEPMARVARRLRLSDRGLAKACTRAGIPVPGRGYWAKLKHGKRVPRITLPPHAAGTAMVVEITRGPRKSDLPALPPEVVKEMARETTPEQGIIVPKDLSHVKSSPDPLPRDRHPARRERVGTMGYSVARPSHRRRQMKPSAARPQAASQSATCQMN